MDNKLTNWSYHKNNVRTLLIDDEIWFVLADVCKVLEITNSRNVTARLEPDEKGVHQVDTLGGQQEMTIINESGLYSVILRSDKPQAKPFRKWVTGEVLPSIRKHGAYMTEQTLEKALTSPDFLIQLATQLKQEQEKNKQLETTIAEQEGQISEFAPKAEYHDEVLNKAGLIAISVIAKDLSMSGQHLNRKLHEHKIIYKQGGTWKPYAEYKWLITESYADYQSYTNLKAAPTLKWTEKGRKWIIEQLNEWND